MQTLLSVPPGRDWARLASVSLAPGARHRLHPCHRKPAQHKQAEHCVRRRVRSEPIRAFPAAYAPVPI